MVGQRGFEPPYHAYQAWALTIRRLAIIERRQVVGKTEGALLNASPGAEASERDLPPQSSRAYGPWFNVVLQIILRLVAPPGLEPGHHKGSGF